MADHLTGKKIGLFGGTFNPIHHGHLNFACELKEKAGLDEVWFIPTSRSPFKQEEKITAEIRAHMLSLAIGDREGFRICDLELKRKGVSYTIDTLRIILEQKKELESFYLCLSEDLLTRFTEWKEYKQIISLIPLLIGVDEKKQRIEPLFAPAIVCPITYFKISATQVRERLKQRLYCDHLVPQKVLDFIYENQLYFNE